MSTSKFTLALNTAVLTASMTILSACGSGDALNGTYENKETFTKYEFKSGSGYQIVSKYGTGGFKDDGTRVEPLKMKIDYKVKGDKVSITIVESRWGKEYTIKEDGSLVGDDGMIFKKVK